MLGGATTRFTDASDYRANLPSVSAELVVTQAGVFDARLTWAKLPNVGLLRAQEALARVAYIALPASTLFLSFAIAPGPGLFWNGVGLLPGEVVFHCRGERLHQRTAGLSHWGFLSVAPAFFAAYGSALAGRQMTPPAIGRILQPAPADLARLLRLHAKVGHLVETKPVMIVHPEISRAIEHELLYALVTCLTNCDADAGRSADPRQTEIMRRLEAVLSTHSNSQWSMRDLCAAVRATERMLRTSCRAIVGIGPSNYLRLRRLTLAHAAMLATDQATVRVADIGRRFGFRNADRFVAAYRRAFGETPSATLGRPRHPLRRSRISESA